MAAAKPDDKLVLLTEDLYVTPKRAHAPRVFVAARGQRVPQSVLDNAGVKAEKPRKGRVADKAMTPADAEDKTADSK